MTAEPEVTLAQIVAALSVTYDDEGVLIWLKSVHNLHGFDRDALLRYVRRIGDADPADFDVVERTGVRG